MERVHKGDNVVSALAVLVKAVLSCDLDSALVGFRAAVSEENALIARYFAEFFGKISLDPEYSNSLNYAGEFLPERETASAHFSSQ